MSTKENKEVEIVRCPYHVVGCVDILTNKQRKEKHLKTNLKEHDALYLENISRLGTLGRYQEADPFVSMSGSRFEFLLPYNLSRSYIFSGNVPIQFKIKSSSIGQCLDVIFDKNFVNSFQLDRIAVHETDSYIADSIPFQKLITDDSPAIPLEGLPVAYCYKVFIDDIKMKKKN